MKFKYPAAALVLSLLASLSGIGSASAQLTINGNFYEDIASANCNGSNGTCTLEFTPTPSSLPRVLFTRLSCQFAGLTTAAYVLYFGVRDSSGAPSRRTESFPISAVRTLSSGSRYYNVLETIDMLFASGKIPAVVGGINTTDTPGTLTCKITGRLQQ